MEEVERARERLENVQSVKPILNGLRTISLGSWQAALKRRSGVQAYAEQLKCMLPPLLPYLQTDPGFLDRLRARLALRQLLQRGTGANAEAQTEGGKVEALVVGSERGLCGRFNLAVAEEAEHYLRERSLRGSHPVLKVLGSRARRVLRRRGYEAESAGSLAVTTLPPISLAFELTGRWLSEYEEHALDAVDLIFNDYRGTGTYETTVTRLIPPQLPTNAFSSGELGDAVEIDAWPPPIIDTDPMGLYATVIEQWTAVQFFSVLLNSSAAEHSTRFQLMESATQNADRLIEDLTLVIQTARRQEITQEMAELATGAGLLQKD